VYACSRRGRKEREGEEGSRATITAFHFKFILNQAVSLLEAKRMRFC